MPVAIIANTTLISNFASVGRLDLLRSCWERLYIPEQVYAEIQDGQLQGYSFYDAIEKEIAPFSPQGWLQLTALLGDDEFKLFGSLLGGIHHGEAACLAIAVVRKWYFLTDDRAARLAARQYQVPVSGTLGTLLLLIKQNKLDVETGDRVLQTMVQKGYYAPVSSLRQL